MRAVSSLITALTSFEPWRCSKVTDERMRAVRVTGLTVKRYDTPSTVGAEEIAGHLQECDEATVRCTGLQRT
jgi:hypothetical protein